MTCRHPYITVFAEENGPLRMWACSECKIRFYPACEICVTIGHRNEVHEPVAKLRRNAVMVEQEALIDDLRAELEALKEAAQELDDSGYLDIITKLNAESEELVIALRASLKGYY